MKRIHILVSGRVVGVFFRDFTQKNAKALGLAGWVKNTINGRVEIVAEGEEDKIQKLIEQVKKGPIGAEIDSVKVDEETYLGEFNDFEIKY